ncbi:preprotein translocase subunit Sec61beta [Pedobacter sp. AK013]|uniref:hypothetical protein n=1 Tax=Pedobacter sp. AK013 TaxID=2723071 RepID=UPI0016193264|nr:hypothetical protein [Pedobacter sp. AK013]MBB6237867.1 preprotein translocase subunit Sec61beta [Pedobacter sp. AK013]
MKIVAAIFIVLILSAGLYNSYKKYKNELLPSSFLAIHFLIGLLVIIGAFFLLFE